jgi:hypothetical protein
MHYQEFDGETEEGCAYNILDKSTPARKAPACRRGILANGQEVQFGGHIVLEKVEFHDKNHLVGEPGETECRIIAGGECRIFFNDCQVYAYRYVDLEKAILKLVQVLDQLRNFPTPLTGRGSFEALVGRLVYYREFPAKILHIDGEQGSVLIAAENVVRNFMPEPWAHEQETPESELKVDLLSPHIYWVREQPD